MTRTLSGALTGLVLLAAPAAAQVDLAWFQQVDAANQQHDFASQVEIGPTGLVVTVVSLAYSGGPPGVIMAFEANGAPAWTATWSHGADPVYVRDIAIDPVSGDVFAVGSSFAFQGGNSVPFTANIALARFAASGTLLWERSWDGPNSQDDYGRRIALDGAGHVVVTGDTYTYVVGTQHAQLAVLSYDMAGTPLWSTVVSSTTSDAGARGSLLRIARDGDIVTAGNGAGDYPDLDFVVTRLDQNGVERWTQTFDGPSSDYDVPFGLALDAASNAYVSGIVSGPSSTQGSPSEAALVKLDTNGVLQWSLIGSATYPNAYSFYDVAVDVRGDVLVCGSTSAVGSPTSRDALLLKFDATGQPIWQRTWVGEGDRLDTFSAMTVDALGGVIVAGVTGDYFSSSMIESDPLVIRYDADGTERWVHRGLFNFPNSDSARDVALGSNGSLVYVGETTSVVGGSKDTLVVRLNEQGIPYCFGDGTATACPCGNASAQGDGTGCLSSLGIGARIRDFGDASRFTDTLVLRASGVTNAPVLFYQGATRLNGGAGTVFGDGLQCVGGGIRRIGTVPASGGEAAYPPPGGVPISIRGFVLQGTTYHYQARYRNSAAFCTSATFNQTNGLSILWSI